MKNKQGINKGFTLIEIIVAMVLITLIGTIISVLVLNKNNNKDLSKVERKILEAAQVFAETEKDKNGQTYVRAVNEYAKGIKIPLTTLEEEGYIDKSLIEEVGNENYYVLLVNSTEYCETGASYILSWTMTENTPIALCDTKPIEGVCDEETVITEIIKEPEIITNNIYITEYISEKMNVSLNKFAVSEEYYDAATDKTNLTKDENGLFTYYDEGKTNNTSVDDNLKQKYWYYRGAVENNYVKLGKDASGNDLYWRILYKNEKNELKLVLDKEIQIQIEDINGTNQNINKDDILLNISKCDRSCRRDNSDVIASYSVVTNTISSVNLYKYQSKNSLSLNSDNPLSSYYYTFTKNWFDSITIDTKEFLLTNAFCVNTRNKYSRGCCGNKEQYNVTSDPFSNNFRCDVGSDGNSSLIKSNFVTEVGFLNYGDLIRAGVIEGNLSNVQNSGNYLLKNGNSFAILETKNWYRNNSEDSTSTKGNSYSENRYTYYYVDNGLRTAVMYQTYYNEDSTPEYSLTKDGINLLAPTESMYIKRNWSIFKANYIKPAIVVNLTNYKLSSSSGTYDNPYEIVKK